MREKVKRNSENWKRRYHAFGCPNIGTLQKIKREEKSNKSGKRYIPVYVLVIHAIIMLSSLLVDSEERENMPKKKKRKQPGKKNPQKVIFITK